MRAGKGKTREGTLDPLKRACLFVPDLASDRGSAGCENDVVSSESLQELQVFLHIHVVFFLDRLMRHIELLLTSCVSRNT